MTYDETENWCDEEFNIDHDLKQRVLGPTKRDQTESHTTPPFKKTCDWGAHNFEITHQPDTPGAASSGGGRGINMLPHFITNPPKGEGKQKGSGKGEGKAGKQEITDVHMDQDSASEKDYYFLEYY